MPPPPIGHTLFLAFKVSRFLAVPKIALSISASFGDKKRLLKRTATLHTMQRPGKGLLTAWRFPIMQPAL